MATARHSSPAIEWHTGLPLLDRFLRCGSSSNARRPDAMFIVATVSGVLTGLVMPRGPVMTWQALLLIVIALLTGELAGLTLGSRWAMLLAPIPFIAAFEITRLGQSGPTVDGINWNIGFGFTDFVAGRGFFIFLMLLPMMLGISWGASYVRHRGDRGDVARHPVRGMLRWGVSWISVGMIITMVIRLLVPAGVPAVTDARGNAVPGSIAELRQVQIGGAEQWIEIRGASEDLPVLLYLPPVPGLGTLPASRHLLDPLTTSFVVVTWDMRGSGKSYTSLDPDTLTVDRLVADTVELTNYLRERFGEEKIYLVAEWWGTLFSVLAAQQHPELYYAVVNSDQMVAPAAWDRLMYTSMLAWASEWEPDEDIARGLIALGPPPYDDIGIYQELTMDFSSDLAAGWMVSGTAVPPGCYWYPGSEWFGWGSYGLDGPEYTLSDRFNALRSRSDVLAMLYPQLQAIDLREDVPSLDVPLYMIDAVQSYTPQLVFGYELPGTLDLSMEWFNALDAPTKLWGPGLLALEPDNLLQFMERFVLPDTYPGYSP